MIKNAQKQVRIWEMCKRCKFYTYFDIAHNSLCNNYSSMKVCTMRYKRTIPFSFPYPNIHDFFVYIYTMSCLLVAAVVKYKHSHILGAVLL